MDEKICRVILEQSPAGYAYFKIFPSEEDLPIDMQLLEANDAFFELTGLIRAEVLGKKLREEILKSEKARFYFSEYFDMIISSQEKKSFDQYITSLNQWNHVEAYSPQKGHLAVWVYDITSEKKNEVNALDEKRFNKILIDAIPSPVFFKNEELRYTNCNKAFELFLGKDYSEVVGKTVYEVFNKEFAEHFHDSDSAMIEEKITSHIYEAKIEIKEGIIRDVIFNKKLITDMNGQNKTIVGVITDITRMKEYEKELEGMKQEMERIFNGTHDAMFLVKVEENYTFRYIIVNTTYEKNTGISNEQIIGKTPQEVVGEKYGLLIEENYKKCKDLGTAIEFEDVIEYPMGLCFFLTTLTPVFKNNIMTHIIGSKKDITLQKKGLEALRKSEERFRSLAKSIPDIICTVNKNRTVTFINQAPMKMNMADVVGASIEKLIQEEYWDIVNQKIENVFTEHTVKECEIATQQNLGEKDWINLKISPLIGNGVVEEVILTFINISKSKMAEKEAIQEKEKAEAENLAKSRFLANMSHEIRTPINGIMGMIQLMQMSELTKEQEEYLKISEAASESLLIVINDILDYSKIEAGKLELEKAPFNIRSMINDVIALFQLSAKERQVVIESTVDQSVPNIIVGDAFRLRQILSNLIGNAVKFTKKGRVDIVVRKIEEIEEQRVKLEFTIKDTGIGMSSNKLGLLFNSFTQLDNSTTRQYGGTGLGLAISKRLVERMSGEIWVESAENEGSRFYFTCILGLQNEEIMLDTTNKDTTEVFSNKSELQILLVEDDMATKSIIKEFCKKRGWNVIVAGNGKEGLAHMKTKEFDIVVMDVQMPVMDGCTATIAIRELEKGKNRHTPIIAMTANALRGDKEKFLEVGMDDYISKPVHLNDFYRMIEKWALR